MRQRGEKRVELQRHCVASHAKTGMAKTAVSFFFIFGLLAVSIWIQRNDGLFHGEHDVTVPHYLSGEPLHKILLDTNKTEVGYGFHARELSYLTDYVDAWAIVYFVKFGAAHYLSVTKILFCVILAMVLWRFLRLSLNASHLTATLLLLLLFSSPAFFLFGSFHRSAKIGAATVAVFLITRMVELTQLPQARRRQWWAVFLPSLLLPLLDSQGFFLLLVTTTLCFTLFFVHRDRIWGSLGALFGCSTLIHFAYREFFAFWLIERVNGYRPSSFLDVPYRWIAQTPLKSLSKGWGLVFDYLNFSFGNLSDFSTHLLVAAVLGWPLLVFANRSGGLDPRVSVRLRVTLLTNVTLCLALWLMSTLMSEKFPVIRNEALKRCYYPLVFSAVTFMALSAFVTQYFGETKIARVLGNLLLIGMVLSNLKALPEHHKIIASGHGVPRESLHHASDRIQAWRHWKDPDFKLPDHLAHDRVYLAVLGAASLRAK